MSSSMKPMSALLATLRGAGRQHLTASTVVVPRQPITGSHVFRIHGFQHAMKAAPNGTAVESIPFDVGGHRWRVRCYPNGNDKEAEGSTSVFLVSLSDATAECKLSFSLLDHTGKPAITGTEKQQRYSSADRSWGWKKFIDKEVPHESKYLEDDCITLLCDVTVQPAMRSEAAVAEPEVPPFDLCGQLVEAIWSKHQTDVAIQVGGETFAAHRWVLEARSPVFKADLENNATGELRVDDMDAEVFKTMLQSMYTDSALPEPDMKADKGVTDMNQQLETTTEATTAERLLVAADRYELERLKLACEEALRPRVDMGSVASMLELAERHGCAALREACLKFLSCPRNMESFTATDGFQQLKRSCPSTMLELVLKQQRP